MCLSVILLSNIWSWIHDMLGSTEAELKKSFHAVFCIQFTLTGLNIMTAIIQFFW